jgi:hypothetical protein
VEADLANDNAEEAYRASITNKHDKTVSSIYKQIPQLLHYGVQHFRKKIGHNLMTMMVRVVQYVLLILLQVSSIILLTFMQILALFLIELMKVVATSLRQVWKWWQDDALTLILLQRIVLSEMVHGFILNGKN